MPYINTSCNHCLAVEHGNARIHTVKTAIATTQVTNPFEERNLTFHGAGLASDAS
jgi:hypothetical protein